VALAAFREVLPEAQSKQEAHAAIACAAANHTK
jgi:hypothetical protein